MKSLKRMQKSLTASATEIYTSSSAGHIPTATSVVESFVLPEYSKLFKSDGGVLYIRPLSMSWPGIMPIPTTTLLCWDKKLLNRTQKRKAQKEYGMDLEIQDMDDFQKIRDDYSKKMGKALSGSTIAEVRQYVQLHLKIELLKCFYGNPPFGSRSDSQGQYICWPILILALAMLDPKDGIGAFIVPASLIHGVTANCISMRKEMLPYIEYIDMDINEYFKEARNNPGMPMVGIVFNFAKTDELVKLKMNGETQEVHYNDVELAVKPELAIADKCKEVFKKNTQLKEVFICDVKQTDGGSGFGTEKEEAKELEKKYYTDIMENSSKTDVVTKGGLQLEIKSDLSDGLQAHISNPSIVKDLRPTSKTKMIAVDYASKDIDEVKGHTEPFYYSCVKMYVRPDTIKKHFKKTSGVLTMKMNYSGYHTQPGKEEYYMPVDRIPIGKCAEGIPVATTEEGEKLRICYTRKLPVFYTQNAKSESNAYNVCIFDLPWIEEAKYKEFTDQDWYDLVGLDKKSIDVVEKWYKEWHDKNAK